MGYSGLVVFVSSLALLLILFRKKFSFHHFLYVFYFAMLRSKVGIALMNKWATKYRTALTRLGYGIVVLGFAAMAVVVWDIGRTIIKLLAGSPAMTAQVVLPVEAKGVFYVPLLYWLISIAVIVVVHEFSHGLYARLHKIRVKSTGIAIAGVGVPFIPAAFVEPDEAQLSKKPVWQQLSVFAAGPMANVLLGLLLFGIFSLALSPTIDSLYAYDGVKITDYMTKDSPAALAALPIGAALTQINSAQIRTVDDFKAVFTTLKPSDSANIITSSGEYQIILGAKPAAASEPYLGIFVEQVKHLLAPTWYNKFFVWFSDLIYWLFLLNLGVGFFNLLPLGPIDGGRMFHTLLQTILPRKKKYAATVWKAVSIVFLVAILGNVIYSFVG